MTDPWADLRSVTMVEDLGLPASTLIMVRKVLRDADALLACLRESNAQMEHLIAWLASDLSALNRRELIEAVDRIADDALAALPEHLE